jgi:hypothetical protein
VRLAGREREHDRSALPVGDDAGLGAEAMIGRRPIIRQRSCGRQETAEVGERPSASRRSRSREVAPILGAPAALGCALMLVPSRNAMPSSTPRAWAAASSRGHTPSLAQRMKSCAARHHGPCSAGIARHRAPFTCRQTIAPIVRRRSRGGVFPFGRHAFKSGSSAAHRSSVNTIPLSRPIAERRQMGAVLKP